MTLDVITENPWNAETSFAGLVPAITPIDSFFVRNHFDEPDLDPGSYRLRIAGETQRPAALGLARLSRFPAVRVTSVLECAGNGRTHIAPRPAGVPWGDRAVGCATWGGPRLRDVLRSVPPSRSAIEVVFRGADGGLQDGRTSRFERSLPIDAAFGPGPILAVRMNGAPLRRSHGAPVRLLVPGWYGMASVKWLTEIEYVSEPFAGFFQKDQYVYDDGAPVGPVRPKAVLLRPQPGQTVPPGLVKLQGRAWGGVGGISKVFVQVDGGTWMPCELSRSEGPWVWRTWTRTVQLISGRHQVRVRACDTAGAWQPLEPVVNRLGYGYNTALVAEVVARPSKAGPPRRRPTKAGSRSSGRTVCHHPFRGRPRLSARNGFSR